MLARLYTAWREQILYLFFGVLTTVINYGVFWLLEVLWQGRHVLLANLITFAAATLFAYVTNKIWVFRSRSWRPAVLAREGAAFVSARLFSFGLEEAGLWAAAYPLGLGRYRLGPVDGVMAAKIELSVVAVVLNYFFSKLLVFTHRHREEADEHADPADPSGLQ